MSSCEAGRLTSGGFASIDDASAFLSLGRTKIYMLMDSTPPELPSVKMGKARRIPWVCLREYAERMLIESGVAIA